PGGSTACRSPRLGQALRGLHRPSSPDPSRPQPDHRSPSRRLKDRLMPVRFLIEKLPVQCQGIVEADPFLQPTKKYPTSIPPEDQKRLTQQITDAINTDVMPAYKTFAVFLRTEYAPKGRTILSVTS